MFRRLCTTYSKVYQKRLPNISLARFKIPQYNFCSSTKQLWWGARHPIAFGTGVATVKTFAADLFTQKVIEKKEALDLRRIALFTTFGCFYLGFFQYWMYVTLYSRLFKGTARFVNQSFRAKMKDRPGQIDLLKQISFDCFIHIQWFFPLYYTLKSSIAHIDGNIFNLPYKTIVSDALGEYKLNYWDDWTAYWKYMGFVPLWARLPANHSISFFYMVILSYMRGSIEDDEELEIVEKKS